MVFIKTSHHFLRFSRDAAVLLQSGPPREHRRALNTHCTLMVKEHKSRSVGCISGSPTIFSGVYSNIKKNKKTAKLLQSNCSHVFRFRD